MDLHEVTTPIPPSELDREQIKRGQREFGNLHPGCGVAVPGNQTLFIARAENATAHWDGIQPFCTFGCFGGSVNLCVIFKDGSSSLVTVPRNHPAFDSLATKPLQVAVVHSGKVLEAFEISQKVNESLCAEAKSHVVLWEDNSCHFWEVLASCHTDPRKYPFRFSVKDRLSIGWVKRCREELVRIWSFQETSLNKCQLSVADDGPDFLKSFISDLQQLRAGLDKLMAYFEREIGNNFALIHRIHQNWDKLSVDTSALSPENFPEFNQLWERWPLTVWNCFLLTACFTDYGKQVAWLDADTNLANPLRIDPSHFPENFAAEDYWDRVPDGNRVAWGKLVSGHDVYISEEKMQSGWERFAGAENPGDALDYSARLLDEALANKRGTIPNRAVVELAFGPFTHIELSETGRFVLGILRTDEGEFYEVYIAPKDHFCSFFMPEGFPFPRQAEVEGGVLLLLAAVIRDFWVVEERETVFEERTQSARSPRIRQQSDKPRIVYLPRVHYAEKPNTSKCNEQLGLAERRAHFVVAHKRKLTDGKSASSHQRILASMYGFDIQEGYTFVGPHERGTLKRETIYRSRSALQSLYTSTVTQATGKPIRWFQFERDVMKLMESIGFEVEHISAAKRGDGGIDVFATKGADFDQINWIIQCKCWHPKRKVSPGTVRELIGVLSAYPQGTRGMIVATCGFSSGAAQAANEANIRLIDGAEFTSLVPAH